VACFGVYTYYESLEQAKRNRSLSYFNEMHSGSILNARVEVAKISYGWDDLSNTDGTELSGEELSEIALQAFSEAPGVIYFDLLNEFFMRARKCVEVGSCDEDTLVDLVSEEAALLYFYFAPKIVQRRADGDIGSDGLIYFKDHFTPDGA